MSVVFGLTFNTSVPVMRKLTDEIFLDAPLTLSLVDTEGANWGYKTAWLFFGTGVFIVVLVWLYVPEPSARNAAELDEMYMKGVPARKMRSYVTDVQMVQQDKSLIGTKTLD